MRNHGLLFASTLALLVCACSDDSGGEGAETASATDTGETAEGTGNEDEIGDDQGTTDESSSDDGTTDDGTTDDGTTDDGTTDDGTTDDGTTDDGTTDDGTTDGTTDDGTTGDTDTTDTDTSDTGDPPCGSTLPVTIRDFQIAHPDFQYTIGVDPGIVEFDLGIDGKPVYAGNPVTPTTTGADNFNQWYNDVDGVNQTFELDIELTEVAPGVFEYANNSFFPIDDQGWGNEGNQHNYHFTLEMHTQFLYEGGEVFSFTGDDDLWVFVNGRLGIDLGGVHGPLQGSIDMDAMANTLQIVPGNLYDIDFFFAERHTVQSNFTITTTIDCFEPQ